MTPLNTAAADPVQAPAADQRPNKHRTDTIIELLAERWPRTFAIYQCRRRPLKIGIDNDIAAAAGAIATDELKAALRFYCGNVGYLLACREGAERIDLNGDVAGTVTAAEAAHAAGIVARRQTKPAPKRDAAAVAAKPIVSPAVPPPATPPRISLADLREAARRRREMAAEAVP